MAMPRRIRFIALFALALGPAAGPGAAAADVPQISLSQAIEAAGTALPLPVVSPGFDAGASLPFHMTLTWRCPAGTARQQLFVSVADTVRLDEATASPHTVRVDVPVRQMEWLLPVQKACATTGSQRPPDQVGENGMRYWRQHAGVAAYATLLCAGKDGATGVTTTAPLDVWLSCPAGSP